MNVEQIREFLRREFPQMTYDVDSAGSRRARVRKRVDHRDLRPGGTISGPVMMTLVDTALYVAILAELGPVALAVTTQMSINFLRKPQAGVDLYCDCELIKVGKRLVVGVASVYSEGENEPVAHGSGTYSIPPRS